MRRAVAELRRGALQLNSNGRLATASNLSSLPWAGALANHAVSQLAYYHNMPDRKPGEARAQKQRNEAKKEPYREWSILYSNAFYFTHPVRVTNLGPTQLKSDVIQFFNGFNLTPRDIWMEYSPELQLMAAFVDMKTFQRRREALRLDKQLLGPRRLTVVATSHQEMKDAICERHACASSGRYVLVSRLSERATMEDVRRLFHNFEVMNQSVVLLRAKPELEGNAPHPEIEDPLLVLTDEQPFMGHKAIVKLHTVEEANRAVRTLSGMYVCNEKVKLKVVV